MRLTQIAVITVLMLFGCGEAEKKMEDVKTSAEDLVESEEGADEGEKTDVSAIELGAEPNRDNVKRIDLDAVPGYEISDMFDAEFRSCSDEYKGYYEVSEKDGIQTYNGAIYFVCEPKVKDEKDKTTLIEYKGFFNNGKKTGRWVEKAKVSHDYAHEDYVIFIEFNNDQCLRSRFNGVLYKDVTPADLTFEGGQVCSFATLRKKASVEQAIEAKKMKKGIK